MRKLLQMPLLLLLSFGILTSCSHKALRKLPIPDVQVATYLGGEDAVVGHLISSSEVRITKDQYLNDYALKPGGFLFSMQAYADFKAWIEKVCREVKCDPGLVKAITKFHGRYLTNFPPEE